MRFHNVFDDRKTESSPPYFPRAVLVHTIEAFEYPSEMFLRDPASGIGNADSHLVGVSHRTNVNAFAGSVY